MIFTKSQHMKAIEGSFKTTEDGKLIFFPGLRPNVFQSFEIPNDQVKENILNALERRRKVDNIFWFILFITGGLLGGKIGYLLAFLLVVVPWFSIRHYLHKKIRVLLSQLEVYEGPDSLRPI
jgi:hypothetical protein